MKGEGGKKDEGEDEIMDLDELLRRERKREEERKATATTETQVIHSE